MTVSISGRARKVAITWAPSNSLAIEAAGSIVRADTPLCTNAVSIPATLDSSPLTGEMKFGAPWPSIALERSQDLPGLGRSVWSSSHIDRTPRWMWGPGPRCSQRVRRMPHSVARASDGRGHDAAHRARRAPPRTPRCNLRGARSGAVRRLVAAFRARENRPLRCRAAVPAVLARDEPTDRGLGPAATVVLIPARAR